MPRWSKAVLRTIGGLDALLSLFGVYLLCASVWGGVFALKASAGAPHFKTAFAAMTAINAGFLVLFGLGAFQLLGLRRSGVIVHAVSSVLLIGYTLLVGMLWLAPPGIGRSIAAATGVGNMGVAPFELLFVVPHLYPIVSTLVLLLTLRKWQPRNPRPFTSKRSRSTRFRQISCRKAAEPSPSETSHAITRERMMSVVGIFATMAYIPELCQLHPRTSITDSGVLPEATHDNFEGFFHGKRNRNRSVATGFNRKDVACPSALGRFLPDTGCDLGTCVRVARPQE